MSITKGFQNRIRMANGKRAWFYVKDVAPLLAYARALEAMLKKHEWSADREDGAAICPECHEPEFRGLVNGRHDEDCQLAKLLEGVEEQPREKP